MGQQETPDSWAYKSAIYQPSDNDVSGLTRISIGAFIGNYTEDIGSLGHSDGAGVGILFKRPQKCALSIANRL